jgi:hypothetical protein
MLPVLTAYCTTEVTQVAVNAVVDPVFGLAQELTAACQHIMMKEPLVDTIYPSLRDCEMYMKQ